MTKIFISYSHADEKLKQELDKHLKILEHSGLVEPWHDRMLRAGDDFAKEIDANLNDADIVLLLISHHFIASDYCFGIEMRRALAREKAGEARVIPVLLDHCVWRIAPFKHLIALPTDAKPIMMYANINEGLADVVCGIQKIVEENGKSRATVELPPPPSGATVVELPRSSNLHVKVATTEHQKDQFIIDTFDYVARFFEGSLKELPDRNPGANLETRFQRIDLVTFTAVAYRNGKNASECMITRGNATLGDIAYSRNLGSRGNSVNDALMLEERDGNLSFKSIMGGFHLGRNKTEGLGMEGAARYFWDTFMEPLQR